MLHYLVSGTTGALTSFKGTMSLKGSSGVIRSRHVRHVAQRLNYYIFRNEANEPPLRITLRAYVQGERRSRLYCETWTDDSHVYNLHPRESMYLYITLNGWAACTWCTRNATRYRWTGTLIRGNSIKFYDFRGRTSPGSSNWVNPENISRI